MLFRPPGTAFEACTGIATRLLQRHYDSCLLPLRISQRYPKSSLPPQNKTLQRLQPCSKSCTTRFACAVRSRWCHSPHSSGLGDRKRIRHCPRVRTSINSNSSLSCSMQLRTLLTIIGIAHLLKSYPPTLSKRRTKSKHYFRYLFALWMTAWRSLRLYGCGVRLSPIHLNPK